MSWSVVHQVTVLLSVIQAVLLTGHCQVAADTDPSPLKLRDVTGSTLLADYAPGGSHPTLNIQVQRPEGSAAPSMTLSLAVGAASSPTVLFQYETFRAGDHTAQMFAAGADVMYLCQVGEETFRLPRRPSTSADCTTEGPGRVPYALVRPGDVMHRVVTGTFPETVVRASLELVASKGLHGGNCAPCQTLHATARSLYRSMEEAAASAPMAMGKATMAAPSVAMDVTAAGNETDATAATEVAMPTAPTDIAADLSRAHAAMGGWMQSRGDNGADKPRTDKTVVHPMHALGACTRTPYDRCGNECFGRCGAGCDCWEWVCGDCRCNKGCADHDHYCSCKGKYHPLCIIGISVIGDTCDCCEQP